MDPYNLAICFGPTLLPIPPDRDQVTFQASVNEIIKIIILSQEEIFPADGGEIYEKMILDRLVLFQISDRPCGMLVSHSTLRAIFSYAHWYYK